MGTGDWGIRIRAYRKLKGYTQVQLARKLGVSVSVLGEVERGARMPTYELARSISATLDVAMEELAPKD